MVLGWALGFLNFNFGFLVLPLPFYSKFLEFFFTLQVMAIIGSVFHQYAKMCKNVPVVMFQDTKFALPFVSFFNFQSFEHQLIHVHYLTLFNSIILGHQVFPLNGKMTSFTLD